MKLQCVKDYIYLTPNKIYNVVDSTTSKVYIENDEGKGSWHPINLFCVLDNECNNISNYPKSQFDVNEWDVVRYLEAVKEFQKDDAKTWKGRFRLVDFQGGPYVPLPELTDDLTIVPSTSLVITRDGVAKVHNVQEFQYGLIRASKAMRYAHNLLVTPLVKVIALESDEGVVAGQTYTIYEELEKYYLLRELNGKFDKDTFMFADCTGYKPDSTINRYLTHVLQNNVQSAVRLFGSLRCRDGSPSSWVALPVMHEDGSVTMSDEYVISGTQLYKVADVNWIASGNYVHFTPMMRTAYNLCQNVEYGDHINILFDVEVEKEESEESIAKQILDSVPMAVSQKYSGSDIKKALLVARELLEV